VPSEFVKIECFFESVPLRKLYTTTGGAGFVLPGTVQAEVIVSVVPEMNPVQFANATGVVEPDGTTAASSTLRFVKSCVAGTQEGVEGGQADVFGALLL
jgi:hypothetical protein